MPASMCTPGLKGGQGGAALVSWHVEGAPKGLCAGGFLCGAGQSHSWEGMWDRTFNMAMFQCGTLGVLLGFSSH